MPSLVRPAVATRPDWMRDQPDIKSDVGDLVLRSWTKQDIPQLKIAYADPEIQRWNLQTISSTAEAKVWVNLWSAKWRKGTGASWAITDVGRRDVVLGQVAFRSLYLTDGLAELSCWIMPGQRRRHLGSTATRTLAEWAIGELSLVRLEIVHSLQNPASCPAALRAGFRIEGVRRSLQWHQDGRFHDMCQHARIRSDSGRTVIGDRVTAGRRRLQAVSRWLPQVRSG